MSLVRTSLIWERGSPGAWPVPHSTSRKIPVRPPQRCHMTVRATSTVGLASRPPGGRRAASTLDRATPLVCHTGQGPGQSSRRQYPGSDAGQTQRSRSPRRRRSGMRGTPRRAPPRAARPAAPRPGLRRGPLHRRARRPQAIRDLVGQVRIRGAGNPLPALDLADRVLAVPDRLPTASRRSLSCRPTVAMTATPHSSSGGAGSARPGARDSTEPRPNRTSTHTDHVSARRRGPHRWSRRPSCRCPRTTSARSRPSTR